MKNKTKLLLFISIALFLVGTVFSAIETATSGSEIAALEKKESVVSEENRELLETISEASSLSSVEKKASELNFIKPERVVYVGGEAPIAKVP